MGQASRQKRERRAGPGATAEPNEPADPPWSPRRPPEVVEEIGVPIATDTAPKIPGGIRRSARQYPLSPMRHRGGNTVRGRRASVVPDPG
jgi:hypothetical protein